MKGIMLPEPVLSTSKGDDEHLALQPQKRRSRSPHPYQRSHQDIKQNNEALAGEQSNLHAPQIRRSFKLSNQDSSRTYFDADHRKRRKDSTSPSDSGTEADDEKGAFLTSLPAPPLKPHKGLKASYGTSSPLLTPSYLDEVTKTAILDSDERRRGSIQGLVPTDDETTKLRQKYVKKRRAELVRRITETLLLGVIVFIAIRKPLRLIASRRTNFRLTTIGGYDIVQEIRALLAYAAILPCLYGLYPIRIILKNHTRSLSQNKAWYYVHIPAAFDPAALLYPTVVPLVVALSVNHIGSKAALLNICLGLASVPSKIVPLNDNVPWYSSIQWLVSATPILISKGARKYDENGGMPSTSSWHIENEVLISLYLLHQALIPVLGYMTTTSLLPAELQLLSVSLINLLFFATSPQAVILKALLWIGGLSLIVLCWKILSWEVALARVPSWRFQRSHYPSRSLRQPGLVRALDDFLNGRLSKCGVILTGPEESDSDAPVVQRSSVQRKTKTQLTRIDIEKKEKINGFINIDLRKPLSAFEDGNPSGFSDEEGTTEIPRTLKAHPRRITLPSCIGSTPKSVASETVHRNKSGRSQDARTLSFQSLTSTQATLVSWMFSAYTYGIVLFLVFFPLRLYIGANALNGHEPVGWALGYMLGDVPWFKQLIKSLALEQWVFLPVLVEQSPSLLARAARVGQIIGTTNVRLLICAYCLTIITSGLAIVLRLSTYVEVDTRRKVFHGMMVAMFLPTIFVDPAFISLALALVLVIFLLLDLFRASQLPPLSKPLTYFLAPYVDGRDHRGPVIVSHIFLLIGCAIPLWLSLAAIERTENSPWQGWEVKSRDMSMTAGVICVGMGDAAASLLGRRFGRRRWPWSGGKSLEGSLAFAIAVVCGLCFSRAWLLFGGWVGDSGDTWATTLEKAGVAGCAASLTEAVLTGGNDNVIVPIILWLLVRGLGM